ncbi:MAG: hypothetical protein QOD30_813, partial [Actinomycetota bacterium]|nr:hypothetical protein [Actinomycetota bacterium]
MTKRVMLTAVAILIAAAGGSMT